jgi:hypothetical protein
MAHKEIFEETGKEIRQKGSKVWDNEENPEVIKIQNKSMEKPLDILSKEMEDLNKQIHITPQNTIKRRDQNKDKDLILDSMENEIENK